MQRVLGWTNEDVLRQTAWLCETMFADWAWLRQVRTVLTDTVADIGVRWEDAGPGERQLMTVTAVSRNLLVVCSVIQPVRRSTSEAGRFTLIWILVLLLAILAIVGGLALSKFLFILLVVAVIIALFGARSTA